MRRYVFAALVATLIALHCVPGVHAAGRAPLRELPNASVGAVPGTRAFVGFSLDRGGVRAYVCDGTLRREPTISQWFSGRWDGRRAIALRAGGHVLRLRAGGGAFDGHAFTVRPVTMPAGVFERRVAPLRGAWIVLPDGRLRGAMVDPRPRKCRLVLVSGPNGSSQWVTVC